MSENTHDDLLAVRRNYFSRYNLSDEISGVIRPKIDETFVMKDGLKRVFAHLLKRSSDGGRPENVLLQGPQGCGKTETAMQFAALSGLPVLKINCALIREPRDWFGYKTAENGNVSWVRSEFAKLVERGGAVILLDEISRATPPVLNSLLPLLDGTGVTFLEEVKQAVMRGPDLFFFATANIGNQFSGTYGKLDKALDDRFAIRINANYLPAEQEINLLHSRTGIETSIAEKMVKVANSVRTNANAGFGSQISSTISTRNLLDTAVLFRTVGIEAFEYTIIPLFSSTGGTQSQEAMIRQIIQSQFG